MMLKYFFLWGDVGPSEARSKYQKAKGVGAGAQYGPYRYAARKFFKKSMLKLHVIFLYFAGQKENVFICVVCKAPLHSPL